MHMMTMKKQLAGLGLLITTLLYLTAGCERVDHYATDPSLRLRFSTDILTFDTVFTTVGSATRGFMVYNPHGENLRISSVTLAGAGRSGFRINVDGHKGNSFQDIDLWKRDSLRVLVEVTVNPGDKDRPFLIEDSIVFLTNGRRQIVRLQAFGQDVRIIRGGQTYTENTTLTAARPYLIYDSLTVAKGVTLTLEPGATLYFHHQAQLIVAGTLKAKGTRDHPITLRGDRLDSIYANVTLPYDRVPGQWGGIRFESTSFDNELEQVSVRNTTFGLDFLPSTPDRRKIRIHNSQITNSSGDLLAAVNCHIEASGSEFSNAVGSTVCLIGGRYRFAHCTLSNHIVLATRSGTSTLVLADTARVDGQPRYFPLSEARFDNCLIDGSITGDTTKTYGGELALVSRDGRPATGSSTFNYHFNACYILTKALKDNPRFVGCLFGFARRPVYVKSGSRKDAYAYDFRLGNKSVGLGAADRTVAAEFPTDRYGVSRLAGATAPTIGAYEHVHQQEEKKPSAR